MSSKGKSKGFTLIEVVISLLVFAIFFLTLSSLHSSSIRLLKDSQDYLKNSFILTKKLYTKDTK